MSKLRDRLTNPKDIERYDRNYNSCEVIMTQAELNEELAKARNDVLDKIRAEVEALYNTKNYLDGRGVTVLDCLKIIDKYKADREVIE